MVGMVDSEDAPMSRVDTWAQAQGTYGKKMPMSGPREPRCPHVRWLRTNASSYSIIPTIILLLHQQLQNKA